MKATRITITRHFLVSEFRTVADEAERIGDRATATRALKLAWRIEHGPPCKPRSPTEIAKAIKDAARALIRIRLDLVLVGRETATLH